MGPKPVFRTWKFGWVIAALSAPALGYPPFWQHIMGEPDFYWIHWLWLCAFVLWGASIMAWKPREEVTS